MSKKIVDQKLSEKGNENLAVVAFIFKEYKLLIGLRNYSERNKVWTVPGGRCDANETVEVTLRREVKEEVGIDNLNIEEFLGQVPGAKEGDILYVFRVTTNHTPKNMEPHKFSEWKYCYLDKIPNNFINPKSLELIK